MPFLAPIFAAGASAIGSIGAALGGMKVLLGILFNVLMSLIQMMMMPKPPKPDDMQQVVRQSVTERFIHLGRVRTGGPILFLEVIDKVLFMVVYFGEGVVDAFEEWYIDQRLIEPDPKTGIIPAKEPYKSSGNSTLYIDSRKGFARETVYRALKENFPGFVTDAFRGDGCATGLLSAKSVKPEETSKTYPNGIPVLNVVGRFGLPLDPRTGKSAFTENLVLQFLHFLRHPDGAAIPDSAIDMTDFAREATYADQVLVTKSGGSVRRYWGSTTWNLTEKIGDVINRLIIAMDARVFLKPNGKIGIQVGRWVEPTVHITDAHIVECEIAKGTTPIQEAAEVIIKFTEPTANYAQATSQPWRDEAVIAKSSGDIKRLTVEAFGIQNHNHARRVAKILSRKTNATWQGTIVTSLHGMNAWDQRFIKLSWSPLGIVDQYFEVTSIGLDESEMLVTMEISAVDKAMYDFDPQTEEGTAPVVPDVIDGFDAQQPSGFAVQASLTSTGVKLEVSVEKPQVPGQHKTKKDANGKPEAGFPWNLDPYAKDDEDTDILTAFQWAQAGTGIWRDIGSVSSAITAEVSGITLPGPYDVRVQHRGSDWSASQWVVIEDVEARSNWAVPAKPTNVTAGVVAPSTVRISFTTPDDDNFAGVRIYRHTANNAAAATLVDTVYGAANATYSADDEADSGTYYYWVASINWRGEKRDESARVAAAPSPIKNN